MGDQFQRLNDALENGTILQMREDPNSLAPERVLVFETAGSIANFKAAVDRVPGFELLLETDETLEADEDFAVLDGRSGREGLVRFDRPIPGRLYAAMPTIDSLRRLIHLWNEWRAGIQLPKGSRPFAELFQQLRTLRTWGPQDRVPDEAIVFWRDQLVGNPADLVRVEIEFWYFESDNRRIRALANVQQMVENSGGRFISEAPIREIAYHGALVDIPRQDVQALVDRREVRFAMVDSIMFIRPQSLLVSPIVEADSVESYVTTGEQPEANENLPIAALFDGVPIASHDLLRGRLALDDPEDLQSEVMVEQRRHGTAMASLILHGDLNASTPSLPRPLYVRPLLRPWSTGEGLELTDPDRLTVDLLHQAVMRMKAGDAKVPSVFLVNLSVADTSRPFTRLVSPLARLIDFLSYKYNILFLVSGGNIEEPLQVPAFSGWTAFESAAMEDRERAIIHALNASKWKRTILSPAESINALSIGAHHYDDVDPRPTASMRIDPYPDSTMPNVTSPLGLGFNRAVKPDVYFPGGREHVTFQRSSNGLVVTGVRPQRLFGLKAAAPDDSGRGRLDQVALTGGTSAATALATRAAHRIFDSLQVQFEDASLLGLDSDHHAVLVKALLVHWARWSSKAGLIREICGPDDGRRHQEQAENAARFLGFGIPTIPDGLECASNRATLVGVGQLSSQEAVSFEIPLPTSLDAATHPRSLTVTLAWLSPIGATQARYRQARLEVAPIDLPERFGVRRIAQYQPEHACSQRGTVFHARYFGAQAVPFVDRGVLLLKVSRKKDATGPGTSAKFGLAVTIESEVEIPIYDEIRDRLKVSVKT